MRIVGLAICLLTVLGAGPALAQVLDITARSGSFVVVRDGEISGQNPSASVLPGDRVILTSTDALVVGTFADGAALLLSESADLDLGAYSQAGGVFLRAALRHGQLSLDSGNQSTPRDVEIATPEGVIRPIGTHFEIEIVSGEMFLAVWDGAIDLTVENGTGADTVSFGEGEDFSFGIVSEQGEVTQLLEAPDNFSGGASTDPGASGGGTTGTTGTTTQDNEVIGNVETGDPEDDDDDDDDAFEETDASPA